ncbi:non-canonical purine NTP pyrophosphatase [Enterococcus rivorum]|uniref:non-canonical purine NTP pyrophosphatase n=1 Tax=Enterococcus rivorum TaxID=762845 RepID=UPI003636FFDD
MKIIVGTNNHGKLQEMQQAIDSEAVQLVTYQEYLPESVEIEETGNTYVENALLKAKFYAEKINRPVLADDGGLELIAFPALLGLKTARFFNENLSEQQKNQQLLELFNGKPELTREIQLKSTLVYAWPEGHYLTSSETLKGELAKKNNR